MRLCIKVKWLNEEGANEFYYISTIELSDNELVYFEQTDKESEALVFDTNTDADKLASIVKTVMSFDMNDSLVPTGVVVTSVETNAVGIEFIRPSHL